MATLIPASETPEIKFRNVYVDATRAAAMTGNRFTKGRPMCPHSVNVARPIIRDLTQAVAASATARRQQSGDLVP